MKHAKKLLVAVLVLMMAMGTMMMSANAASGGGFTASWDTECNFCDEYHANAGDFITAHNYQDVHDDQGHFYDDHTTITITGPAFSGNPDKAHYIDMGYGDSDYSAGGTAASMTFNLNGGMLVIDNGNSNCVTYVNGTGSGTGDNKSQLLVLSGTVYVKGTFGELATASGVSVTMYGDTTIKDTSVTFNNSTYSSEVQVYTGNFTQALRNNAGDPHNHDCPSGLTVEDGDVMVCPTSTVPLRFLHVTNADVTLAGVNIDSVWCKSDHCSTDGNIYHNNTVNYALELTGSGSITSTNSSTNTITGYKAGVYQTGGTLKLQKYTVTTKGYSYTTNSSTYYNVYTNDVCENNAAYIEGASETVFTDCTFRMPTVVNHHTNYGGDTVSITGGSNIKFVGGTISGHAYGTGSDLDDCTCDEDNLDSSYVALPALHVTAGTVTLQGTAITSDNQNNAVVISGGTVTFDANSGTPTTVNNSVDLTHSNSYLSKTGVAVSGSATVNLTNAEIKADKTGVDVDGTATVNMTTATVEVNTQPNGWHADEDSSDSSATYTVYGVNVESSASLDMVSGGSVSITATVQSNTPALNLSAYAIYNAGTASNAGTATLNGNVYTNKSFTNTGTMTITHPGDDVTHALHNDSSGTFTNSGTSVTVNGSGLNDGTFSNTAGTVSFTGTNSNGCSFTNNKTVTNASGATISVGDDLTNNGTNGTVTNNGTINVTDDVTNSGTITNNSSATVDIDGMMTNTGTIDNSGSTFDVAEYVTNNKSITNNASANMSVGQYVKTTGTDNANKSTITNNGNFTISGTALSDGTKALDIQGYSEVTLNKGVYINAGNSATTVGVYVAENSTFVLNADSFVSSNTTNINAGHKGIENHGTTTFTDGKIYISGGNVHSYGIENSKILTIGDHNYPSTTTGEQPIIEDNSSSESAAVMNMNSAAVAAIYNAEITSHSGYGIQTIGGADTALLAYGHN